MAKTKKRVMKSESAVGKIAYRVLDANGNCLDVRGTHNFALFRAQRLAEMADEETELRICSQPVFGAPSLLTRIVRDKEGVVFTHVVSNED